MTDVTNNHVTGLGMPDGTSIAPRETKSYENWAVNAANGVVAHWVSTGLLSVDGYEEVVDPTQEEVEDALDELSEEDEKEALITQLAELGIKADKRSSVETLQQKLDEAMGQ